MPDSCDCVRFAVISARNPMGKQKTEQWNLEAENKMKQWLDKENVSYRRIYGCSPVLDYIEPSFLVEALDKTHAIELSCLYRQNALFWIERGMLWLVPCNDRYFKEVCLGLFVDRLIDDKKTSRAQYLS